MKKLIYLVLAAVLFAVGCSESFDDSKIWDKLDDHENRIAKLEELCKQMNTNISSLQTLVNALNQKEFITNVAPISKNGEEIGYTITFTSGKTITIYHGQDGADGKDGINGENGADGKDGSTPIIGVKKASDGIYYWTLNGEWLLDDEGNKIKAVGTDGKDGEDGKDGQDGNDGATGPQGPQGPAGENGADGEDGITPQLKIEEGYWYISYDNGSSWKQLGKATGEDGQDGEDGADGKDGKDGADGADGDSFFQGLDLSNEDYIIFTLADGTQFKIPTWAAYEKLQTLCNQINTNITALQKIVDAVNANDYVKSITPLTENGKEIGYTITFTKSGTITIYHGKDGQNGQDGAVGPQGPAGENGADGENGTDGSTPVIGVKKDADNIYYWTVNGEWLLDENGNKVKAQGQDGSNGQNGAAGENGTDGEDGKDGQNGADGKDGITPQLKIENGKWYVSYDEGDSWTELGQATGDKGEQGEQGPQGPQGPQGEAGDSFFQNVTQDDEYVYFTLADGTQISILKASAISSIEISYVPRYDDGKATVVFTTAEDSKIEMDFQIMPKSAAAIIAKDWENTLSLKAVETQTRAVEYIDMPISKCTADATNGTITITASGKNLPQTFFDAETKVRAALFYENSIGGAVSEYVELTVYDDFTNPETNNNKIFYTTTTGEKIFPYTTEPAVFGAILISNIYENGQGVLTFDDAITSIGHQAFCNCSSLTSITIPDSVTTIGNWAFDGCTSLPVENNIRYAGTCVVGVADKSLTSYTLKEGTRFIGYSAFKGCSSLTSITIPDSVIEIGNYAFYGCSSLTTITIPDSVTTIGYEAFRGCSSLTSVTIGDSVTTIGDCAFQYCSSLASITIPDSVTEINSLTFYGCSSLTSVTIPDSVTSIGYSAFNGCSSLTSVTIPDSVTTIEDNAFYGCSSLTTAVIGSGVKSIEYSAFENCYFLNEVICKPTTPPTAGHNSGKWDAFKSIGTSPKIYVPYESVEAYRTADYWKDYANYIVAYDFEKGEIVIESRNNQIFYTATAKIEVKKAEDFGANCISNEWDSTTGEGVMTFDADVTKVGEGAFSWRTKLTSVTLPGSVKTIETYAFSNCNVLKNVNIPDGVTAIGNEAFKNCYRLEQISLPEGLKSIGEYAFNKCTDLTAVVIPNSVTSIGQCAFLDCESLTNATLGSGIKEISRGLFGGTCLHSINIPNGVTTIAREAFISCWRLTSVTIPDSVEYIGQESFASCNNMQSVTIGSGVTTIMDSAFEYCSRLKEVFCKPTTPPILGYCVFDSNASDRKIYVPESANDVVIDAYKSAKNWDSYTDVIVEKAM